MEKHFRNDNFHNVEFTKKHKLTLIVFAFTFVIMILSLITWENFGITVFQGWTSFLTGTSLG